MKSDIHFKFKPINDKQQEINLDDLGKSLIGLDSLIKKLIKVTQIQGDVEIHATNYRDGSIIVDVAIDFIQYINHLPFEKLSDYANFIEIAIEFSTDKASQLLEEIKTFHDSANVYFSKHPVDLAFLAAVITALIKKARKHKTEKEIVNSKLPQKVAEELYKLMKKQTFKKALISIIEDKIQSIEISPDRLFKKSVIIDQNNFQEYLVEDDQILPHLKNGTCHKLQGEIKSLKSTRGDSLTFCLSFKEKEYNLDLFPPEGVSTKKYTDFYKEKVVLSAEIVRTSLYKKPKLNLINIDYIQGSLNF